MLAPDGALILIELKRAKTPREVVAQALDYATWAESLEVEELGRIYARFSNGGDLGQAFRDWFGQPLDEDALNQSHQIVIIAASLDASSERIVGYFSRRDIAINALCFQVFESDGGRPSEQEPWNGEYYASFLHDETRFWDEAVKYGFICAGGDS